MVATLSQLDAYSSTPAAPSQPFFVGDERNDQIRRWGPVFAVFGDDLEAILVGMRAAMPSFDELSEQVYAATRRYGALLTTMCGATVEADKAMVVYDCCEGVTVLLMCKNDDGNQETHKQLSSFDEETLYLEERVFKEILSRAIRLFFLKCVADMSGIVTVSVAGREFLFLRTEMRETILNSLHLRVDAELA